MAIWSVNDIKNLTQILVRKNQSNYISPQDLFYQWNSEQTAYFQDLTGRWQARNNGKTGANTGLLENETIMTKLTPFTSPYTLTISGGNATKPADFFYRLALRINGVDCLKINHNQIANVNASVIDPPSVADNKYYFVEYEDYYYFLPHTGITSADLDYLTQPTDIVWGFTYDTAGRQVYNSGTSVQPMWATNDIIEITKRTLAGLGVSYKDKDFEQYGQKAQVTGE
jgi:hypothetical protein